MKCAGCGFELSAGARACPACGRAAVVASSQRVWLAAVAGVVMVAVLAGTVAVLILSDAPTATVIASPPTPPTPPAGSMFPEPKAAGMAACAMRCKCSDDKNLAACDVPACSAIEAQQHGREGYSVGACAECLTLRACEQIKQGACNGVCIFSPYDAREH